MHRRAFCNGHYLKSCVDQLDRDTHALACALNAALQDLADAELLANLLGGEFCISKLLDRRAGDDLQRTVKLPPRSQVRSKRR
jgi:hypothetical protein